MEIGAQLYTVRNFCNNLDGFSESLKKIADIGYKNVQISGTCEYDPQWLTGELKKNGLRCVITHTPADELRSDAVKTAKKHDVFGCKYIGLGYYDFNENEKQCFKDFLKLYTPITNILFQNGKYFMYHNHSFEFKKIDGKIILEHIAEAFPSDKFGFTLDTYWVQVGGGDPAAWIERLSGRVPCIHLKDYSFGSVMSVVGEGNINFDRVFEKAENAGTEYMLVEQDDCNGEDPFDCLERSYKFLKSRGF